MDRMIQSQEYDEANSEDETQPLIINLQPELARYPSGQYYEEPSAFNSDGASQSYLSRRAPVMYGSYGGQHDNISAVLSRYKYYNKLSPHNEAALRMPDHVVPDTFLISIFLPSKLGSQSSIITVFAMWNTMIGTSLLTMPWGIQQSGFATGILILVMVSLIMFYTSYRILKSTEGLDINSSLIEFSDVCRHYLGKWAELSSLLFSLATLLGGAIVYWILMTNFLYNVVTFIYVHVNGGESPRYDIVNTTAGDVYCPTGGPPQPQPIHNMSNWTTSATPYQRSVFWDVWDMQKTVPFFLILIILPLTNFKSPTFFTKFNSLGTLSVIFLVVFVTVKAVKWGVNVDFHNMDSGFYIPEFRVTFPSLSGISALALFIQNCVLSIMRNQKNPQHNTRDLGLAYICVTSTYLYIGIAFFITFPANKVCISDNFLNNILSTDILAFVARVFLILQMVAVFPLLAFIFRVQLFNTLFGSVWPSWKHVVCLNLVIIIICTLFARFLPHIGKIIGFVGAFCGFAYAMFLPCLIYMMQLKHQCLLTLVPIIIHSTLIMLGFLNFVAQFVLLGISSH